MTAAPLHRRVWLVALVVIAVLTPTAACAASPSSPDLASRPSTSPTSNSATGTTTGTSTTRPATAVPRPDHVVVVLFENKGRGSIIGDPDAPYFNTLAAGGANMSQSYAIRHPSQPNYIALFSGSTQGVKDDACTHEFAADNQANQLLTAGLSFMSYSEDLPEAGSKVCSKGKYVRKHAPWTDFTNVPPEVQQPFTSFPKDYTELPDVSWVIPNLCSDMHDCSVATGDAWLRDNLGGYAAWAMENNSLLIVTFDEDDHNENNQIATIFYGEQVAPGTYDQRITHYSVLRTMEDMYGVPHLLKAKQAKTIKDIWK
jgi:phosphatidylinositol-3-phosphatase